MSAPEDRALGGWRAGLRVGLGFAATTFALALSFGALARTQGWSATAATVFSMVAFSGSAQFAVLTSLASGGGAGFAIGSAALMNARFLPMGVAVSSSLRGGRLRRGLEAQAVVDGSWASAYLANARFDRGKLLAATAVQWPAWVAGTAVGATLELSTGFVERWALDVIFPAFFLVLLLDAARGSATARVVAAAAGLLAAGMLLVAPVGPALFASSAAALVALRFHRTGTP